MKPNTKATIVSFIIFAVIFIIVRSLVVNIFSFNNTLIASIIAAIVASVLSPRRMLVYKQSGKEVQLKWFFSKKIIRFKN